MPLVNIETLRTMNNKEKILLASACCSGLLILALATTFIVNSIHFIQEGFVGIYYKHGALQNQIGLPGLNLKAPLFTSHEQVQIRPVSHILPAFTAVTKDAIQITFRDVAVITSIIQSDVIWLMRRFGTPWRTILVFDRLKEEIRRHCFANNIDSVYNDNFTDMSTIIIEGTVNAIKRLGQGKVDILNLIIPKPEIPYDIANNYKRVKVQWTEKLVAEKIQEKELVIKKTQEMKAVADAKRALAVEKFELDKALLQKQMQKNMSLLVDETYRLTEQNKARVHKFRREQEAAGNQLVLTPPYVLLKIAESFSKNAKLYFSGEQTPMTAIFDKLTQAIKHTP